MGWIRIATRVCARWACAVLGAVLIASSASASQPVRAAAGSKYQPPPVKSKGGALALCPNPRGLEKFSAGVVRLAMEDALSYGTKSLESDLGHSDRAWWPEVRRLWQSTANRKGLKNQRVDGRQMGVHIAYASVVRASCGLGLVIKSLSIGVGPRPSDCNDCVASMFFVDRLGRPFVYWSN